MGAKETPSEGLNFITQFCHKARFFSLLEVQKSLLSKAHKARLHRFTKPYNSFADHCTKHLVIAHQSNGSISMDGRTCPTRQVVGVQNTIQSKHESLNCVIKAELQLLTLVHKKADERYNPALVDFNGKRSKDFDGCDLHEKVSSFICSLRSKCAQNCSLIAILPTTP